MQLGKDTTLHLMIVDDSVDDAEAIANGLRNNGIAVRPSRPESTDAFASLLSSQALDLVLVAEGSQVIPLDQVVAQVGSSGKDLPILVLMDSVDTQRMLQMTALGIRSILLRDQQAHIDAVVRSE